MKTFKTGIWVALFFALIFIYISYAHANVTYISINPNDNLFRLVVDEEGVSFVKFRVMTDKGQYLEFTKPAKEIKIEYLGDIDETI